MKKVLILLVVVFVVIIAALFIGKNIVAKTAITSGVKAVTGLEMDIGSMNVGIMNTLIGINNLKLYNPADYSDRVMIDMSEIYVDYDLRAFLKRNAHLEEVRINLNKLTVIKNRNGKLNIDSLKVVRDDKKSKEPEEKKKADKKKTEIKIDTLDLKIGKVAYKDFSKGKKPIVLEYNVNLHEKFYNITDVNEIGKLILVKALSKTDIANLAGFALDSLQKDVLGLVGKAPILGKPIQDVGEKAVDTLKETAEELKKTLKLPFGKK